MWVVDEISHVIQEMLLEGNLHNIIVFTVITSSSVLSVVGAIKHIYTFIYNLRHGRQNALHQQPPASAMPRRFSSSTDSSFGDKTRFSKMRRTQSTTSWSERKVLKSAQWNRASRLKKQQQVNPRCLKCDAAGWERFCVFGLCGQCCEAEGGCHKGGHSQRPMSYTPWVLQSSKTAMMVDLSNMCLREVPERLGYESMDATTLNLSHNLLSDLPEHMSVMRSIVNVSLKQNLFSYIPSFFRSLHKLSCLDLRNNSFHIFPEPLLHLTHLRKLYLDHNQLRELPDDIDRLLSLECLSVGNNNLSFIPSAVFNIRRLKSLSFRGNKKVSLLPSAVENLICLQTLDLSHCDISFLPPCLSACAMLRKLLLSHNRISQLPSEISQCFRLERLCVDHNCLSHLPAGLLYRQANLTLSACNNKFVARPDSQLMCVVLDELPSSRRCPVASLKSLTRSLIVRCRVPTEQLPVPLQEELSFTSCCWSCGKCEEPRSTRFIKFSSFGHSSHTLPFLYTFCNYHLLGGRVKAATAGGAGEESTASLCDFYSLCVL
ncbi:leucine-rich repeat-containing protein 58 [Aplysia californica]|uniref:Leucine-rich repeat-containing protein 58 n=1 Tax=Aplysia californica TaxID=6500 RepID=A0ABM0K3Q0_APLCA|nr:leucine-rich repeat-containing protein 58 [Aplysia californica]XP_035828220.1 leucine-rich repeat-containing protein 58 [Aplysia californica]XP_035828221.1 leucine-rich repeat-containing protein 58 [Aplysia californica]